MSTARLIAEDDGTIFLVSLLLMILLHQTVKEITTRTDLKRDFTLQPDYNRYFEFRIFYPLYVDTK